MHLMVFNRAEISSFFLSFSNQRGWHARREEQKHRACAGKSAGMNVTRSDLLPTSRYILLWFKPRDGLNLVNVLKEQAGHLNFIEFEYCNASYLGVGMLIK